MSLNEKWVGPFYIKHEFSVWVHKESSKLILFEDLDIITENYGFGKFCRSDSQIFAYTNRIILRRYGYEILTEL